MGVERINTIVTSREAILAVCRGLAAEKGLQALNIRTVAQRCGISIGSVYTYFPSKADLVAATVQTIWQDILHMETISQQSDSFPNYVTWLFDSLRSGAADYPNFLADHSMSFTNSEKGKGRQVMEAYFDHVKAGMLTALQSDSKVSKAAFSEQFKKSDFVDFIFFSLLSLLVKQEPSCDMLTEIIRRTIY